MTRQGRLDGNISGFLVTNFTDQQHIGVLTHQGSQCVGKGQINLWLHLHLIDPVDLVLDGILQP